LRRIQEQLKLNEKDIAHIEQPLRDQADRKYHEKSKIEVKSQQIGKEKHDTDLVSKTTGTDYTELRNLLGDKQWQKADEKTAQIMVKVAKRE